MSDRISISALREWVGPVTSKTRHQGVLVSRIEVTALVEAVEAAQDLYDEGESFRRRTRLGAALARFDFGGEK